MSSPPIWKIPLEADAMIQEHDQDLLGEIHRHLTRASAEIHDSRRRAEPSSWRYGVIDALIHEIRLHVLGLFEDGDHEIRHFPVHGEH